MLQIRIRQASCSVLALFALGGVGGSVGCSSASPVYYNPNADLSVVQKVAVMPLTNLSNDRYAGERIRELLNVELLASSPFDIIEPSQVARGMRAVEIGRPEEITQEKLAALASNIGADAFFMGTILEFREKQSGTIKYPEVVLTLRLVDGQSGLPIWSTREIESGASIWTRLFGVGERSVTEASESLIRDVLYTLY